MSAPLHGYPPVFSGGVASYGVGDRSLVPVGATGFRGLARRLAAASRTRRFSRRVCRRSGWWAGLAGRIIGRPRS